MSGAGVIPGARPVFRNASAFTCNSHRIGIDSSNGADSARRDPNGADASLFLNSFPIACPRSARVLQCILPAMTANDEPRAGLHAV